jgi:hypothetical protein
MSEDKNAFAGELSSESKEHKERMRRQAASKMAQEEHSSGVTSITKPAGTILGAIIGTYFGGAAGGKLGASAGNKAGSGFGKLAAGEDSGDSLKEALVPDRSTAEAFGGFIGDKVGAKVGAKDGVKGAAKAGKAFNAAPKVAK